MKKFLLLFLASIIGGSLKTFANIESAKNLSPMQKQQIAWALTFLKDQHVLIDAANNTTRLDADILSILEIEGLISRKPVQMSSSTTNGFQ